MNQLSLGFDTASAIFSPCRRYRYWLWRRWAEGPHCCFIMLNPSTADEVQSDPTITRCMGFARRWGFSGLSVGNIFAYRATDPQEMIRQADPVGEENDWQLNDMAEQASKIVCAWGNHGTLLHRSHKVRRLLDRFELWHLGRNKSGEPKHPLYVKADKQLERLP